MWCWMCDAREAAAAQAGRPPAPPPPSAIVRWDSCCSVAPLWNPKTLPYPPFYPAAVSTRGHRKSHALVAVDGQRDGHNRV